MQTRSRREVLVLVDWFEVAILFVVYIGNLSSLLVAGQYSTAMKERAAYLTFLKYLDGQTIGRCMHG